MSYFSRRTGALFLLGALHAAGVAHANPRYVPRQRFQPAFPVIAAQPAKVDAAEVTPTLAAGVPTLPPADGNAPRRLPVVAISTPLAQPPIRVAEGEYNPSPDKPAADTPPVKEDLKDALGAKKEKATAEKTSASADEPPAEPTDLHKRVDLPEKKDFDPPKPAEEKKAEEDKPPPTLGQALFPSQSPLETGKMGPKYDLSDNFYWYDLGTKKKPVDFGGWFQGGYSSKSDAVLNTRPDALNLHQAWLYAEKVPEQKADTYDFGFRADILYGLDGENTQAYGNNPGRWDFQNGFDHGSYHWAIPQLYASMGYDKINLKVGHFFTLHGQEVVPSPQNFFYSHSFTWNFTEPFTHTGALATYKIDDTNELYAGYVLGWDSGFDRFNSASAGQFGFKWTPDKDFNLIYLTTMGNNGWIGHGYTHSIVATFQLTDKLQYILSDDVVATNLGFLGGIGGDSTHTYSFNHYLLYNYSETVGMGVRYERFVANAKNHNVFTAGLNLKPLGNVIVRPELRYQDRDPLGGGHAFIAAIDAIFTF